MKTRLLTLRTSLCFILPALILAALIAGCSGIPSLGPETHSREISLFDGVSLNGWQGLVANPYQLQNMGAAEKTQLQHEANEKMRRHWKVEDGVLCFDGKGSHLVTQKEYGDFELQMEWQITPGGDSGVYLRGFPQVQIWDHLKNPVGSGGLFNNQKEGANPLEVADSPLGDWNHFRILMKADRVTVYLNDRLVVNDTPLENYWRRNEPLPIRGPIELQSHGTPLKFRNITIKEL